MTEMHFIVDAAPEGGYTARAVGASIFIEGNSLKELRAQARDALHCHFNAEVALNPIPRVRFKSLKRMAGQ